MGFTFHASFLRFIYLPVFRYAINTIGIIFKAFIYMAAFFKCGTFILEK